MELRHIRYFLAVAEELNFTRAAEKLAIAQPPLSRQIKDLEEELGAPLFLRNPHSLRLSEEGVLFRQYAMQIIALAERSVEDVRDLNQGLHGTVYIGMVEGSAPHLISDWIADFHKLHPRVQYDMWNGNSDDVTTRVTRGLCELGLIVEPYNPVGLEGIPVYEEPWVVIMSKRHPLAAQEGDDLPLAALKGCDLIVPSRQSRQEEIGKWFEQIGVTPRISCRMSNTLNAVELAGHDVGIAIYPASSGNKQDLTELDVSMDVCVKRLVNPCKTARYTLIYAKNRPLSRAASEFMHFIRASVQ